MVIVCLDGFALNPGDLSWAAVEQLGAFTWHDRTPADQVVARARDAEIVLTNKTPLDYIATKCHSNGYLMAR